MDKINFPEKTAQPDWFLTWVFRVCAFGFLGVVVVCVFTIPATFALDGYYGHDVATNIVVLTVSYTLLLWLSWLFLRYFKSQKKHAAVKIRIDRSGVYYCYADGRSDSLLYADLQRSNICYMRDVFAKTQRSGPTLFRVFVNGAPYTVTFMTDIGYSYYTRNRRELLAHFVKGIQIFRPDLHVSPNVFSEFYINPETYTFDKKEWMKTIVLVTFFLIIVLIMIDLYMAYRFDSFLIFD